MCVYIHDYMYIYIYIMGTSPLPQMKDSVAALKPGRGTLLPGEQVMYA